VHSAEKVNISGGRTFHTLAQPPS